MSSALIRTAGVWYEGQRNDKGSVNTNVMCAGVYVTEFLVEYFPLEDSVYSTKAKSQVKKAGAARVRRILADHGEMRPFTAEGGRTSRATLDLVRSLAYAFNEAGSEEGLSDFCAEDRMAVASQVQAWFVERVQEDFFGRQRIKAEIDVYRPMRQNIAALLDSGRERGGTAAGAIAQHLVGARLTLSFPDCEINVESYTTADAQTNRVGDYQVGDTAFHVTLAPGAAVFERRCDDNLKHGFRPVVLVPDSKVAAARQNADIAGIAHRTGVQSIEDFIGSWLEESGGFMKSDIQAQLLLLLEQYNVRIQAAEADKSLMIEIPANL